MTLAIRAPLIALLILAAVCQSAPAQPPQAGRRPGNELRGLSPDQARELQRKIDDTIHEAGVVESASAIEIHSELPGEAVVLFVVPEGTAVKKGDRLLRFDEAKIRAAVEQQQAELQQAQQEVREAEAALQSAELWLTETIPAAEAKLRVAELARGRYLDEGGELEIATASADRAIAIAKQRLAVEEHRLAMKAADAEVVKLAIAEAKATLEATTAAKQLLTRHTRAYQTALLDAAVLEASALLKQTKGEGATKRQLASSALAARQAAMTAHAERLESLQQQLQHCHVMAPRDGIVIYATPGARRESSLEAGATVQQGQALLQIPDLDRLQVRVGVHETRIQRVQVGQSVTLRVDGLPRKSFAGKVTFIHRTPQPSRWYTQGVEYAVIVEIAKPSKDLRLGLSALAEISTMPQPPDEK